MKLTDSKIKNILLEGNYITEEDLSRAEKSAEKQKNSVLDYLLFNDLITKDIVGQAISEYYNIPYSDLNSFVPAKDQVLIIPKDQAKNLRIVLFNEDKSQVTITTDNPTQEDLKIKLKDLFPGKKIKISYSLPEDIDSILSFYQTELNTRFVEIIENQKKVAPEIIDQIIEDALNLKVSDIHCEPQDSYAVVRFRIDGILHDVGEIPIEYFGNIINRIKVQAKLRIDVHNVPQDGAIRYQIQDNDRPVDIRVSVIPTLNGEKVVLRVLSSYIGSLNLGEIGLSKDLQDKIVNSTKKPFGMILVTGPTGSGKTTTLYSILRNLNTREVNITTIEDPVEYKIKGINQIQTNQQTGLTFARGLRAIARQDPNIILVGEIRDSETADISVNAALTGHLLLTTFHANNALSAIPRFIDMGVEPFLLSSTLELIVSQRLVRRICDSCKVSYTVSKSEIDKIKTGLSKQFGSGEITLYRGKGCGSCAGTGYRGQIGIFEFLSISPEIQDLISKNPSTIEITKLAESEGYKNMFEDGISKVKIGITSLDELLRVTNI